MKQLKKVAVTMVNGGNSANQGIAQSQESNQDSS